MNATTHAIFGVAALVGVSLFTGEDPALYAYPAAAIAAWIPDVDNPRSRLGNGLSRTKSPILDKLIRPVSWGLKALSFVLFRTVGHRTLTHSLLGVLIFAAIVSPLAPLVPGLYAALLAGYASHLFADALNIRGVPLFWPMGKPFKLLPGGVRSGGAFEFVVAIVMVLATGYGIYELYPAIGRSFDEFLAFTP
jgi:inner membrane protein